MLLSGRGDFFESRGRRYSFFSQKSEVGGAVYLIAFFGERASLIRMAGETSQGRDAQRRGPRQDGSPARASSLECKFTIVIKNGELAQMGPVEIAGYQ